MRLKRIVAAGAALALAAGAVTSAQSPPILDLATFPRASLEIVQPGQHPARTFHFDVWVADNEARAEQGLMYVRELPAERGMVFPLEPPRIEAMWMKNTYIELDMLFVAADGHVSKIIERARPMSLNTLSSDGPVRAVIELKGGEARRLGLHVGDLASWKLTKGS